MESHHAITKILHVSPDSWLLSEHGFYFSTFSLVQEELNVGKAVKVTSSVSFSSSHSRFQDQREMVPLDVIQC